MGEKEAIQIGLLSKPQLNHNTTPRQPQDNLTQFNESCV